MKNHLHVEFLRLGVALDEVFQRPPDAVVHVVQLSGPVVGLWELQQAPAQQGRAERHGEVELHIVAGCRDIGGISQLFRIFLAEKVWWGGGVGGLLATSVCCGSEPRVPFLPSEPSVDAEITVSSGENQIKASILKAWRWPRGF